MPTSPDPNDSQTDVNATTDDTESPFAWVDVFTLADRGRVHQDLQAIWSSGAASDLLETLRRQLVDCFGQLDDVDAATRNLSQFVSESRSPTSLLALFERDQDALSALLQVFATSQSLADRLIADPESFDLLRASDGQPADRRFLVDELVSELRSFESANRAALAIRKFVSRETIRVAYGEFVRELSPEKVGRQLSYVCDAVLESALDFVVRQTTARLGALRRLDGSQPEFAVIGYGTLGGEEIGYAESLKLVFIVDQIDRKNSSHVAFYETVVRSLIRLVSGSGSEPHGVAIDLSQRPIPKLTVSFDDATLLGESATQVDKDGSPQDSQATVYGLDESVRAFERSSVLWNRLSFIKARVVAGSQELGTRLISRLEPWVYRRFLNRNDLQDIHALRHKLLRRADDSAAADDDILRDPGGRRDLELTIQFLQLLHGSDLPSVRDRNTHDAIFALEQAGCITHSESNLLAGNYARLCRLQHQLSIMFDLGNSCLPDDTALRRRLAWRLGIRHADRPEGDLERFKELLDDSFKVNRKIINHLMVDAPDDTGESSVETELMLDPDPSIDLVDAVLQKYGFTDTRRAMEDLAQLRTESVPFLSSRRCQHFFASLAPRLLKELAETPSPQETLSQLVAVTDSLGAKATLWELMAVSPATLKLTVLMCAAAPYLSELLIANPGMIDELIDSLLTNRLPTPGRLEAQSIELVRGAKDIDPIMHGFKNSAHLTIGVHEMLGKETIGATHAALSDTAESLIRRILENEQETLAARVGDPFDSDGNAAEMITVALGKFGGREPNYHSDLDLIFLYSAEGETKRRVGGPRATISNRQFFNQVAQGVIRRVTATGGPMGQMYELDGRLRPTGEEGVVAVSKDSFLRRFEIGAAPLWQRLALCKARAISGALRTRRRFESDIVNLLRKATWRSGMADEVMALRMRMEETTGEDNLKRGRGGTVDVELIAQMLTLKQLSTSESDAPVYQIRTGTTQLIEDLIKSGVVPDETGLTLTANYQTLRCVEAVLRLMNTDARHELPKDPASLNMMAHMMGEPTPEMILVRCQQARLSNRRIFEQLIRQAAEPAV